ncbi:ferrochelatase, mitochondrial [Anthonomus grandis grandis]|uniref:ferrochelatase, mitochondrial n=1 Tax=Anthonomus grandis grandis TaxID=2921223 RepID=UPI002165C3D4|nr:ferrochelatase, mitochondrial [Anthonomus grandis grandis]
MLAIRNLTFSCIKLQYGARYASGAPSPKTGIVMLNMGGPQNIDQVHDYLLRIMTDRDVIQFPFAQDYMGQWIAKRRTAKVQKRYQEIGGGSPILKWTILQGDLLCKKLDKESPETAPHRAYPAFRYASPFTDEALDQLNKDKVERAIIFSQYPQYSCATSGSSFNMVYRYFEKHGLMKNMKLSIIDRWSAHPLLAKCFADLIKNELQNLPEDVRNEAVILFSAHSLPLKAVNRGDPYPSEVGCTVQLVMNELRHCNPFQLVWQSKVGPLPWLGPFTDDSVKGYAKQGKKALVVVPIAFVNEHIETLHELDIELVEDAHKAGIQIIRRVPAPNDHPLFIEAMTDIVKNHLKSNQAVNPKLTNRCPHCENDVCATSKKWFFENCTL